MDHLTNLIADIVNGFASIPGSTWAGFFSLLGGGLGVSVITELYKRHRLNKKEVAIAKSFLGLVITALAGVFTLAQSIIMYGAVNPHFLGIHTPQLMGVVTAVYLFGGSAAYKKIAAFLTRFKAAFDALSPDQPTTTPVTTSVTTVSLATPAPTATPVSSSSNDMLS